MNSRHAIALALISLLLILIPIGASDSPILPALLWPYLFWVELSIGSLGLLLIHRLSGGVWGEILNQPLRAGAALLPLTGLLLLPILFGLSTIYPWTDPRELPAAGDWWLNAPFFILRSLLYLLIWIALAWQVGALTDRRPTGPAAGWSGFALLALIVTASLAATDWIMSLDPHWYSAIFGLLLCAASATSALALAILWRVTLDHPAGEPDQWHDLGNLLLGLTLLWGYLVLMQFLTLWIANLPHEIRWLIPRLEGGWQGFGVALIGLHLLVLPLLLWRAAKRHPHSLGLAAGGVLAGQALYALWLTLPTLRMETPRFTELSLFAGIGGLWLSLLGWRLERTWLAARDRGEGR